MKIRKPLSCRAVENACHRVIRSVETLRGYFGKAVIKRKKELLTKEKANIKF